MKRLFFAVSLALLSHAAQASVPAGVTLSDLTQFLPKAMPDAALIEAARKSDPRFTAGSSQFRYDLHLDAAPAAGQGDALVYRASALMSDASGRLFFRKLAITVGGEPRAVQEVSVKQDFPLSAMHFTISVGLIDRMVIVEDAAHGIQLSFPLGVGGVDEAVWGSSFRILTPRYRGAVVDRANVNPAGAPPYRGLPIMYITNRNGGNDGIAFHITLISDDEMRAKSLNFLRRGFESHACMRMRLDDLKQLYTIVMRAGDSRLPISVEYFLWNRNERGERDPRAGLVKDIHPYPFMNDSYEHVTYFANRYPHYAIGTDQLIMMNRTKGQPELSRLTGFSADDQAALREFDTLKGELDKLR